jgi:dCMP deaminase
MERLRPDWDTTWMAVADTVALRSKCDSRQVGAVIVDSTNRPISTGYNGPPRNFPGANDRTCNSFCPRRQSGAQPFSYGLSCPSVHAEANALMFADRRDYEGGTIYVTAACCQDCTKLIANSGIHRVIVRVDERDSHRDPQASIDFLRSCGLDVRTI